MLNLRLSRTAEVSWQSPDHKNHKLFKERGFENYRGKVRIDNVIFNCVVRAGKAHFGDVFYDINLEVDTYLPHTQSASDINKVSTSKDNISETSPAVNSNSMQKSEDDADGISGFSVFSDDGECGESNSAQGNEYDITLDDVKQIRNIPRKSINKFTSDEIAKSEKWARKFYKELGLKSPFFRAWFGDWRAYDNSLIEISKIPEYVPTNEARKANRGNVTNIDTGWEIRISREGETNTISHAGDGRKSEYALAGIQNLVANAMLLDSEVHEHHKNNAKDRIIFDHKLYSLGMDSKGVIALYKITVEETFQDIKHPNDKRFHNIRYIEKVAENIGSLTVENNAQRAESTVDVSTTSYSISDLFALVKKYDPEFKPKPANKLLLNEDGTPKVFYHGTSKKNGEFYIFD